MPANSESEVLAYCGSCKMDLMAVVVAKVGSKLVKVQCKTCKKERAYKAPKGVSEPGQEAPAKTSTRKKKASGDSNSESARSSSVEAEWTRLMGEATKAPRVKYTPKTKLTLGDVVQHPTFGDGIVMRIQYPDKAEIIFKNDLKLLIHSRT